MREEQDTAFAREGALFIVGAGFSRAITDQAPLNRELLRAVISYGAPVLKRYAKKYGEERDIERLLTLVDLEGASAPEATEEARAQVAADREAIDAEIAGYFRPLRLGKLDAQVPAAALAFASTLLRPNDGIISLNYDCLLEGVLDLSGVWTPNGGYGRIENVLGGDPVPRNPLGITVYKIHGSENFVESRLKRSDDLRQTVIGLEIDESIYPNASKYYHFGGGMYEPRRYIIAPSFVKLPHVDIAAMMIDLEQQVERFRHLVVIGCSLRREDSFLWLLLTRFLNRDVGRSLSFTIVDPAAYCIMERVRSYWVGDVEEVARVTLIESSWVTALDSLRDVLAAAREA